MNLENMSFNVNVPGKSNNKPKRVRSTPSNISKWQMREWIGNAGLDDDTKNELLTRMEHYPGNTLGYFYDNIHKIIQQIHAKRQDSQRKNNTEDA